MFKKTIFAIIIISFCAIVFSGYIHEQDIDDLAYIIAIGFDSGEEDNLKLTFQISIPSENGSSGSSTSDSSSSSSSKKGMSDTLNQTIECSSIYSGLDKANNIISKKLSLSHCKFIVFSDEIASLGILDYIYTLENSLELRANCNVLVSKGPAEEFLSSANPIMEHSTSKYYQGITSASRYSGYTSDATLKTVYASLSDTFGETTTILGSIEKDVSGSSGESESSGDSGSSGGGESSGDSGSSGGGESSGGSGSSEESSSSSIVIGGIAAFKGDKLVGFLSAKEALPHLIVTNNLKESVISIPSPFVDGKKIDLHIYDFSNAKNNVSIEGSGPHVKTTSSLRATILSNNDGFNSSSKEDISKIENAVSEYLEEEILKYYEKTAKEFKSDISRLGKYAVYQFPTTADWESYNWLNEFENSTFEVSVKVNIQSSYFIS